tara:strand:+ start:52403 stop:53161 length:759 start_codon:yes stop_codon:yes gene_type:complete
MASHKEIKARIAEYYRFNKNEVSGLAIVTLITAFIFSICGVGASWECSTNEPTDLALWFGRLMLLLVIVAVSIIFRASIQKMYALAQGYKITMKTWYVGNYIALALSLLSFGSFNLVLSGSFESAFMVKQRLGEFRYGFSNLENAFIGLFGMVSSILLALIFGILSFAYPENIIYSKAVNINLIMGFCNLLPFPQLDGLKMFFGSRPLYYISFIVMLLSSILILSGTRIGLIALVILMALGIIFFVLKGSEK